MVKRKIMVLQGFEKTTAIVTGAASGIGKAISKILVESGCSAILIDKNEEALLQAVKELGSSAEGRVADVTHYEAIKKIVEETVKVHGRLDYIFNNAAITIMGEVRDIAIEDWYEVIAVDLNGLVNGVVAAYSAMIKQKSGHIVNISSITGITPTAMLIPYCASKFGVVGLSHSLRMEAKGLGVKVSVACPNLINTPIWTQAKVFGSKAKSPKDFLKLFGARTHLLDVDKAAEIILKGVLKNKATILNDFTSRLLWWGYRLSPSVWMWLYDKCLMKKFRSVRNEIRE